MTRCIAIGIAFTFTAALSAQTGQTIQDEYAVYELLDPGSGSFRTDYEVSVTTPGATVFFDKIGRGLTTVPTTTDRVIDLMTGRSLAMEQVTGRQAKSDGLADADPQGEYLRIHLTRPVPAGGGQARLRIIHTYKGVQSYRAEGDGLLFNRQIGIPRVAFVLPEGFVLTDCNVPSQVLSDPDGRLRISFMYQGPAPIALTIKAVKATPREETAKPQALTDGRSWELPPAQGPTERARLAERAHQDRDIVYFLHQPETNAFSLYHDYTESREGTDKYLNIVRTGSKVSNPSGMLLDTGDSAESRDRNRRAGRGCRNRSGAAHLAADEEVVVTSFPPVTKGQSVRLRLSETYTAPESYRLQGGEFAFERSLGRPRNSVVLPRGWYLTWLSIPGVVHQTPDGLTRVDFVNGRPDSIDVLMKGRRLAPATGR